MVVAGGYMFMHSLCSLNEGLHNCNSLDGSHLLTMPTAAGLHADSCK
jgi:hypothetical protein